MQAVDVVIRFVPVVILVLALLAAVSTACGALMFRRILRETAREDESADLTRTSEDYVRWLGRAVAALGVFALVLVSVAVILPLKDEGLRLSLFIVAVVGAAGFVGFGSWLGSSSSSGERAIQAACSAAGRAEGAGGR